MDGRGRVDGRLNCTPTQHRNETASMDASASFRPNKAMDGRGSLDDPEARTSAHPRNKAASTDASKKTAESACKPGPVRLAA